MIVSRVDGVCQKVSATLSELVKAGEIEKVKRGVYLGPPEASSINEAAERLIRTLKEEEVYLNEYQSITEARERIGHFITQVYHHKCPHSALGYLTPMEFQRKTFS